MLRIHKEYEEEVSAYLGPMQIFNNTTSFLMQVDSSYEQDYFFLPLFDSRERDITCSNWNQIRDTAVMCSF